MVQRRARTVKPWPGASPAYGASVGPGFFREGRADRHAWPQISISAKLKGGSSQDRWPCVDLAARGGEELDGVVLHEDPDRVGTE